MGLKMTKVTKNPNIVVGHFFVKVLHYKEKFSFSCYKASTKISELAATWTRSGRSSSGDHWRVCLSSLCIISKVVLKAFHLTLETDRQISSKYDLALKSNQQPRASSTLPSL